MKYFAYGSNMSLPRLQQRIPGARRIGAGVLPGHLLRFHKLSKVDGSGKCDALLTGNHGDRVFGVLYQLPDGAKDVLDAVEGLGYGYLDKIVSVRDRRGSAVAAFTYYATNIDPSLRPYSWYLYHLVYGARDAGLPAEYIEVIEQQQSIDDADRARDTRERAIYR
ncbi:gamma-glutamylcyclotransferase family protein [Haliea sp. E17]|uniref:gamma-glutamylcyclotransferase family protein n=1 Tax=Haliea sp. E17 TaxID=3401576 RepID=UPI003AB06985